MSKIEPTPWIKSRPLEEIEREGKLAQLISYAHSIQCDLKQRVEKLSYENWMHYSLNIEAIIEGLDELRKVLDRYRELEKNKGARRG